MNSTKMKNSFHGKFEPGSSMRDQGQPAGPPGWTVWTGRVLSGLALLFLAFDAGMKVLAPPPAVEGTVRLGYPPSVLLGLGILQLVLLAVYLVPRTAPIGAVLWTGYLGGAVASHVRIGDPLLTHTLFPVYVAALLWGGLWLRDVRVNALYAPPSGLNR
ncbi:MAG TPA: DoxX family protein [Bryobacteraceae bacterium]|nr:DoxX family protein [Bryobacteraceae bacterium]